MLPHKNIFIRRIIFQVGNHKFLKSVQRGQRVRNAYAVNTLVIGSALETGYKITSYKENPAIRQYFQRTKYVYGVSISDGITN